MDSPLVALSPSRGSALNSKMPTPVSTPSKMGASSPNKSPLKTQSGINKQANTPVRTNAVDEDLIDWDEGRSSPFLSGPVEDKENLHVRERSDMVSRSSSTNSSAPTEIIHRELTGIEIDAPPTITKHRTPFMIAEDETCTFHTSRSMVTKSVSNSPSKPTLSRTSTNSSHESFAIKSQSSYESRSTHRVASYNTEAENFTMLEVEEPNIDDTCFSTFSEVPNADMTAFARLGQRSPTKQMLFDQTPRTTTFCTPGTARTRVARSPSPTPRRGPAALPEYHDSSDTTNLLLDFTQQFENISMSQRYRSPTRRSPQKQTTESHLLSYLNTQRSPQKTVVNPTTPRATKNNLLNLLDFELPPAPTPRSVPTITVREMESLKSKYSSEISSLRATLSGREAEVEALKRAVGDAERRVGEAVETSREERNKRECVEKEKEEWERRGRDFEDILRKVKEEVLNAEKERAALMTRIEDAEERTREAENRATEAEARAIEAATKIVDTGVSSADGQDGSLFTADQVQKQIDEKVHSLSTELHTIYKKKHVTKIAGLKKGMEAKAREQKAELQSRIEELERKNDELQLRLDGTLSGVLPADIAAKLSQAQDSLAVDTEQRERDAKELEERNALIERQKAELLGREQELVAARAEFASLMSDLERERVEKGELVAAVDEMLALQNDITTVNPEIGSAVEDFRKSIAGTAARPSGLRAPGAFGFAGAAGSGIKAPSMSRSTSGGKSRMMSNIERMASGRTLD